MRVILLLLLSTFSSWSYGQQCRNEKEIEGITSSCQMSYYRFAPECNFGDGLCLSLVLQGLLNKNLFDYRADIRRVYNTPLKRKLFKKTKKYQVHYKSMLSDLEEATNSEFCAEMDSYWLYDLKYKGFGFLSNSLIPSGRLYRFINVSKVGSYDFIYASEKDAVDIEDWENTSSTKYIFFEVKPSKGFILTNILRFIWFTSNISYDFEGNLDISCEESNSLSSFYIYKVHK